VLLVIAAMLQVASPDAAVVMGSRLSVPASRANKVLATVTKALREKGLGTVPDDELSRRLRKLGMRDTAVCAGKRSCLIELGKQLHVARLVAVSVAYVKPDFSVSLELIDVESGKGGASASGVLDSNGPTLDRDLAGLAGELMQVLAASTPAAEAATAPATSPPPPPAEGGPKTEPAPKPEAAPPAATAVTGPSATVAASPRGHRPLPWILGAAAVVFLGTAGLLLGETLKLSDWLTGVPLGPGHASELTEAGALGAKSDANLAMGFGIGAAGVALLLAIIATITGLGVGS
jgi:hypothetical protein